MEEEIWVLAGRVEKLEKDNRISVLTKWVSDTYLWLQTEVIKMIDIQGGDLNAFKEELLEIRERLYAIEEELKAFVKRRDSPEESDSSFQPTIPATEDVKQEPPKDWIPMRQNITVSVPSESEEPEKK